MMRLCADRHLENLIADAADAAAARFIVFTFSGHSILTSRYLQWRLLFSIMICLREKQNLLYLWRHFFAYIISAKFSGHFSVSVIICLN